MLAPRLTVKSEVSPPPNRRQKFSVKPAAGPSKSILTRASEPTLMQRNACCPEPCSLSHCLTFISV